MGSGVKKSQAIARGGLFAALGFVFLYLSGVLPMLRLSFLAFSGVCVMLALVSAGTVTGTVCYAVTSVAGVLFAPDKAAVIAFVCLFGLYPVIKQLLRATMGIGRILVKLLFFNLAASLCVYLMAVVFGVMQLPSVAILLLPLVIIGLNLLFFLYDFVLGFFANWAQSRKFGR